MKFAPKDGGSREVTFEVIEELDFHEQGIALIALGLLTAKRRKDATSRFRSAKLGVVLAQNEMTKKEEGEDEPVKVETTATLDATDAVELGTALDQLIKDAPEGIKAQVGMGAHGCSIHAVEAHLAGTMLEQINQEFGLDIGQTEDQPFGFTLDPA